MPAKQERVRIAVLDDYQNVALSLADWSALDERAIVTVFNDHLADSDALIERLQPFEVVCVMRERTPMTRAIIERLPKLRLIASTAMMTIVAGVVDRPWQLPMPNATTWLAVIGLAALSTALAYIVFFQIVRRSGATNVMLVTLLIPVTAILLGYLVLGESISAREIIGAVVIGSALLLIDGRVLRFVRADASV